MKNWFLSYPEEAFPVGGGSSLQLSLPLRTAPGLTASVDPQDTEVQITPFLTDEGVMLRQCSFDNVKFKNASLLNLVSLKFFSHFLNSFLLEDEIIQVKCVMFQQLVKM